MSDESQLLEELQAASQGDAALLASILDRHSTRLKRMVNLRMDNRVRRRVDASDIIQDTYVEASKRLHEYLSKPDVTFFVWLRFLTLQQLLRAQRHHLGVKARDVGREVSLFRGPLPEANSAALAAQLVGKLTSPSHAAIKAETKLRIQQALNNMDPIDCEILAMRHFEHLGNNEIATILKISEPAACNRYVRALKHLKKCLAPPSASEA